jgi:aerobic carbon-monoxide dehydrogenase medium subunit
VTFEYFRPASVGEAVRLLGKYGGEAKVLAGGQSLMPLINMRLARPSVVIDINRLGELSYIREEDGVLAIGALTRHQTLERSDAVRRSVPLLKAATALIGYPSIRSRATFGGSMAHADPAAEYPSVAVAVGAQMVVRGPSGERRIDAENFFQGLLTTALQEDELLTEVRVPKQKPGTGWAYEELATRPGDYATVGVVAQLSLDAAGRCRDVGLTYTAVGPTPIRADRAAAALNGQAATTEDFERAGRIAAEEVQPESDALASAAYKREMTRVFTRRALEAALGRLKSSGNGKAA